MGGRRRHLQAEVAFPLKDGVTRCDVSLAPPCLNPPQYGSVLGTDASQNPHWYSPMMPRDLQSARSQT